MGCMRAGDNKACAFVHLPASLRCLPEPDTVVVVSFLPSARIISRPPKTDIIYGIPYLLCFAYRIFLFAATK